jgi:S-layer homology domain.
LLLVTLVARAHHLPFTDVPTSGVVHDAVGWLYARGITTGCTATLYCPNDPVTRASMALFMNRLGKVLSPVYRWVESDSGALDIDASPRICSTGDFTPSFPMRALVIGTVSLAGC